MNLMKIAGTAALAGALGAAALGVGVGSAQAAPKPKPKPVVPSNTDFSQPPGHVGQDLGIPPGQFKKIYKIRVGLPGPPPTISDPIRNPFFGVPPGHWDDVVWPPILVPTPH